MIDAKTRLIALIGHPVAHSLSPAMHNAAFRQLGLNFVYLAFDVKNLKLAVDAMRQLDFRGYSVTIPFKEKIIKHLDRTDALAAKIMAVNTVVNENNLLVGYNTDAPAAINALKTKTELNGKKVALIGAGGAGRAIAFALQQEKALVTISDIDFLKAKSLAAAIGCSCAQIEKLNSLDFDILVNATPVGMSPKANAMPVEKTLLKKDLLVFDIVYNPLETMLLREAKKAGCQTIAGIEMFLAQGAEQFRLWTGKEAPLELMREVVLKELQK